MSNQKELMFKALETGVMEARTREDRTLNNKLAKIMKVRWQSREDRDRLFSIMRNNQSSAGTPSRLSQGSSERQTPMKVLNLSPGDFDTKKSLRDRRRSVVAADPEPVKGITDRRRKRIKDKDPRLQDPKNPDLGIQEDIGTSEYAAMINSMTDTELIETFGSLRDVKAWAKDVIGLEFATNMSKVKFFTFLRESTRKEDSANPFEDTQEEE